MHKLLSLVVVVSAGCASSAVPLDEMLSVASPNTVVDTGGLAAGGRVGLLPWRVCPIEVYPPDGSVADRGGKSVTDVFPHGVVTRLSVTQLLVDPDRTTALVADVVDDHASPYRLAIKTGEKIDCLIQWTEALERLHSVVGTTVSFRPSGEGCNALALKGDGVRKLVENSAVVRTFEVTAITVNEQGGKATPWLRVGDIEVRHDVLASCFAPVSGGEGVLDANAPAPKERAFEQVAGAYPGTCHPSRDGGGVECVSSIAVWQGKLRDNQVDLRRVRRTLGAVLMRDGAIGAAPVSERVVVNVVEVRNQRIATVRQGVTAAIAELASRPVAGVAVGDASQGPGDLRVDVELKDLMLGRLTTAKQPATSEYILRYEDKYNTAYDEAQTAANSARTARDVANSAYQQALTQYETTKKACEMAGREAKKLVGGVWGSVLGAVGEAGCDIALAPSNEEMVKAEVALSTAESTLSTTPRYVKAPVMAPWNYEKTTYRRSVGVKVVLRIQDTKSGVTETRTVPVEHVWEDFAVMRDEPHNVEAHEVAAAMLSSADGLLPDLAAKVEGAVRATMGQRIVEIGLPPARTALAAAFGATMGDQLLDSSAYLVARDRLRGALGRGEVTVKAGEPATASLGAIAVPPKSCLMVVAVASDMSRRVKLAAKGGRIADNRGVVPAYFEVCGENDGLGTIELTSDGDGSVRWAAYSTALFETTIAATATP